MHNRSVWMDQPERGNVLGMSILVWMALRLGRRGTRLLLLPISIYFFLFAPAARKAVRTYLARATKQRPRARDLFRHFLMFAATQLDRVYFLDGQLGLFDIHVYGERELSKILDLGQGCFLMGSHLGSFEILRILGFSEIRDSCFNAHARRNRPQDQFRFTYDQAGNAIRGYYPGAHRLHA